MLAPLPEQTAAANLIQLDQDTAYQFDRGEGIHRVRFNYSGKNWTVADVAAIQINTNAPIAIIPQQYTTEGKMMPGAAVNGRNVGKQWNEITQQEMAWRLRQQGFFVLTPSIQYYGENLDGYQAFEHFIAAIHKGNPHVQTVLLTADAHNPNVQNPLPGAQMLVTGTNPRNPKWEALIQRHIAAFYQQVGLGNQGVRVRGGHSDVEGSSAAWHPLIERAAGYGATVSIMEVSRAIDIVEQAGSIENGRQWAAPLFDAIADAMTEWACLQGYGLTSCKELSYVTTH
uniref:N-acetylmuramoyl-L-alanine amidase n=1 Tax=Rheinheimera sp. BAL341 TaxID=1708203 RepID=A0A486XKY4_9GAMM